MNGVDAVLLADWQWMARGGSRPHCLCFPRRTLLSLSTWSKTKDGRPEGSLTLRWRSVWFAAPRAFTLACGQPETEGIQACFRFGRDCCRCRSAQNLPHGARG